MNARLELFLFDDRVAQAWVPFTLTRPVGELRLGALTFRERAERFAGIRCTGQLAGQHLTSFDEPGAAPCLDIARVETSSTSPRLFLCSRSVPTADAKFSPDGPSGVVRLGGRVAGWYVAPGDSPPPADFLVGLDASGCDAPTVAEHDGDLLDHVWQLVTRNAHQITLDCHAMQRAESASSVPEGVYVLGNAATGLRIAPRTQIEPGVVIDVRHGPVRIEDDVVIRAFTRLAGPAWIGRGAIVLGGSLDAVSIGPVCRVRGEVEETIFQGYSNKAHDGFLGHACVGRWVNLGALTTNSDLKNNYGPVRLWTPAGEVDTGEMKFGCLLGDHVKTGIGVMLNTGTIVGAGSNLFGAVQPPKYVPPFSWGSGESLSKYRLDRFLVVAERALSRRNMDFTVGMRAVLETAWHSTRDH